MAQEMIATVCISNALCTSTLNSLEIVLYHLLHSLVVPVPTLRAGTHGEISFDSVDSRSSSVYVNVNYSHEHTVNS